VSVTGAAAVLAAHTVLANTALAANTVLAHGAVLAKAKSSATDNEVTPGVLGFLVVAGMGVLLYFLLKSMNRQLKKIPPPPEEPEEPGETDAAADPDAAARNESPGRAGGSGHVRGPDLPDRLGQAPPAQRR
jgi:hypothetical protein